MPEDRAIPGMNHRQPQDLEPIVFSRRKFRKAVGFSLDLSPDQGFRLLAAVNAEKPEKHVPVSLDCLQDLELFVP
jgi:hypothetical protein